MDQRVRTNPKSKHTDQTWFQILFCSCEPRWFPTSTLVSTPKTPRSMHNPICFVLFWQDLRPQKVKNISCSDFSPRAFTLHEDVICMDLTCDCTHKGDGFDNLHKLLARLYGVTVLHVRTHDISVSACTHVCMCACVCVFTYINMRKHWQVYSCVHVKIRVSVCVYVCIGVYTCTCMYTWMRVSVGVCVCVLWICLHIYVHLSFSRSFTKGLWVFSLIDPTDSV